MEGSFEEDFARVTGSPPPKTEDPLRDKYWNLPVRELCELNEAAFSDPEKERHQLFLLLLMTVVHQYWNGFKYGHRGSYPWNYSPTPNDPEPLEGDYLGHNIGALAVDSRGRVIDFDFNHNELLSSTAEHAEARLVRRLFNLALLSDSWETLRPPPPKSEPVWRRAKVDLSAVTIYTSLESCSQCSGVMALARVGQVVYLQTDPGMYFIGRILRNLTTANLRAPRPISGGEVGIDFFGRLDAEFSRFVDRVGTEPFYVDPRGKQDSIPSVTSFLCSGQAKDIYAEGEQRFRASTPESLRFADFAPPVEGALNNSEVIGEARDFLAYALTTGKRGTPHT